MISTAIAQAASNFMPVKSVNKGDTQSSEFIFRHKSSGVNEIQIGKSLEETIENLAVSVPITRGFVRVQKT